MSRPDRHDFDPSILREYDLRGTVGRTLHEADAYAWGRSFASHVRRASGGEGPWRVAVGRDGRTTSPCLEAALVEGLAASGVDVVRIGLGPTPMLYFAEATLGVEAGVQVTGSHNPREDNGFKMALHGAACFGEELHRIAALAAAGDWDRGAGAVTETAVMGAYVDRLVAALAPVAPAFRIGWDAGNGAAGPVVEQLVKRLPGEHHLLFTDVDGDFPNHHPDPTIESNLADLKALVAAKRLHFGVAFDGDGDRIGAVDGAGRVVWGDQILAILAGPVLAEEPGAPIVADVKASNALFDRITALGGRAVMAPSGHSRIKARMKAEGAPLAGEMSGHLFFGQDYYGFDDALYAAVRLTRALGLSGRTLAEERDAMPALVATPELRFAVDPARKDAVVAEVRERLAAAGANLVLVDGVRVTDADGWWLLRASGTQDMLTARAEATDEAALARLLARLDEQLAASGVTRG
jgi:phosphomannomutase